MELTITDLQNLLENKEWQALITDYKSQVEQAQNRVLLAYLEGVKEEQDLNYKYVAARQLEVAIEIRSQVEIIDLTAVKEFIKFVDLVIGDYEAKIKKQLVADGNIYFTETDVEIRKANTKIEFVGWLDNEIEKLKSPKKDDNVMDRIREE